MFSMKEKNYLLAGKVTELKPHTETCNRNNLRKEIYSKNEKWALFFFSWECHYWFTPFSHFSWKTHLVNNQTNFTILLVDVLNPERLLGVSTNDVIWHAWLTGTSGIESGISIAERNSNDSFD